MILQMHSLVGPWPPVKCGNTIIEYASTIKCLGVVIDDKLQWKQQVNKVTKLYGHQISILKRMRQLPSKVLEEIHFKTIFPQVTFSISVWGSCSPATFVQIEELHIKAAKIIHKVPKNIMDCDVLQYVYWQNLGHTYKCKLAVEMFKAKNMLSRLSSHGQITESRRRGKLMVIPRKKLDLGRDCFI